MPGQILSILSHVVHGYVGNRAVTFPLQYCGWNVDALNTTNLSNHPGYGQFSGQIEDGELINKVLNGLNDIHNSIGTYDMIITGYLPSEDIILTLKRLIFDKLETIVKPIIILDPILGDNGKLYVPPQTIHTYKEILNSDKIDLITPNQFEFEYFSGIPITDITSLKASIVQFNQLYKVKNIIISSINIDNKMYCVGSSVNGNFLIPINEIPCKFFGCGDLFTALVADNFYKQGKLNEKVLVDSTTKLSKILQHTFDIGRQRNPDISVINDISLIELKQFLLQEFNDTSGIQMFEL